MRRIARVISFFCATPYEKNKVVRLGLKWWWVLVLAGFCGLLTNTGAAAAAPSRQDTPSATPEKKTEKAAPEKSGARSAAKSSTHKSAPAQEKKTGVGTSRKAGSARSAASRRRRRVMSPRVKRIRQAFVASADLRPMAQQLVQDRSAAGYAAVEAYARKHGKEDAGALAWLVVGYAHVLDHDCGKAIDPLNRAKPLSGDLSDYVDYYLGACYLQTGHQAEGLAALANFSSNHPDSLLVRDAHLSYATALVAEGRASEAVELLEKDRLPVRADIELELGKAYAATGQSTKAADVLANVYYKMPTSPEADAAYGELKRLPGAPAPTPEQRKARAELLMKARRFADAAEEYHELADHANPEEKAAALLTYADALQRSGRNREAKALLENLPGATPEQTAHQLYILGEIAWSLDQNNVFYQMVDQLRQSAPTSPWLEQALLSAANLHLVHHEYDQALDAYREAQQRFPSGARASYVHWKAAWLTLRQGRNDDAKKMFEEQIALYATGAETPAALYWRARLAEEDNQPGMARAFYQKLSDRYRNFYYAELARQRLKQLPPATDAAAEFPVLDRVPSLDSTGKVQDSEPPADELHFQKAQLLANGGLVDFAVRELQAAATADGGSWGPSETAQLYDETGHYDQAIEVMKHSAPNYFALDIPDLPRKYWEALFPKAFWTDLKRNAAANGLDPYLVASLIRQESEFNP